MKDPAKEFGIVRMGGTVGWILVAWPFTFILVDWTAVSQAQTHGLKEWFDVVLKSGLTGDALKAATKWTFIVSGIISLALAVFSLTLPHTPAKKKTEGAGESLAWLEALKLLKHPFVLVLWLVTFVDSFVHNCYFNWTGTFLGTAPAAGGVGIAGNWNIMPVIDHRAGGGVAHHAGAGRDAQETRLALDDDHRHPRPRGALRGLCVFFRNPPD